MYDVESHGWNIYTKLDGCPVRHEQIQKAANIASLDSKGIYPCFTSNIHVRCRGIIHPNYISTRALCPVRRGTYIDPSRSFAQP